MLLCVLMSAASIYAAESPTVRVGDYEAGAGAYGLIISYKGQHLSDGSYFSFWEAPGYGKGLGSVSAKDALRTAKTLITAEGDGRRLTFNGTNGVIIFTYSALVRSNGVTVSLTVDTVNASVKIGAEEYAAFVLPAALAADCAYEMMPGGSTAVFPSAGETNGKVTLAPAARGYRISARLGLVEIRGSGVNVSLTDARFNKNHPRERCAFWVNAASGAILLRQAVTTFISVVPQRTDKGAIYIAAKDAPALLTAIIIPANPNSYEKKGAAELQAYLKQATASDIPIRTGDGTDARGAIVLGSVAAERGFIDTGMIGTVSPDGYAIVSSNGTIAVTGTRGLGTLYGVYALLGRLGFKFYAKDCEITPVITSLTVPSFTETRKPFFEYRSVSSAGDPKLGETPVEDVPAISKLDPQCKQHWDHTSDYQLPFYKYGKEHPEWYAKDANGKNWDFKGGVHLCLSHPEVRRIALERMLTAVQAHPDGTFFVVTQGDGADWCLCENCRAIDPVPVRKAGGYSLGVSDRLLDYVNYMAREIGKKYPRVTIISLAYTPATQPPPVKLKPEPNVRLWFCPYPTPGGAGCQTHDLTCPQNAGALKDLMGWLAVSPGNMYIYDYPRAYNQYYESQPTFYAMRNKIQFYAKNNIRGINFCGTPAVFGQLFRYVIGKMLWDPSTDTEKHIDEFMKAYYGPSAADMRAYFDLLQRSVGEGEAGYHLHCESRNSGLVKPELAVKAYAVIAKAKAAVKNDTVLSERVLFEEFAGILWSDLNDNTSTDLIGTDGQPDPDVLWKLRDLYDICKARSIQTFNRREDGRIWFEKTFGIPTTVSPWYAEPLIPALLYSPVTANILDVVTALHQSNTPGGIMLRLTAFKGGIGPSSYSYQCPERVAVWVDPKKHGKSEMHARFSLHVIPARASLVLSALDDDKPGAAKIRISMNGVVVFNGENTAAERDWTMLTFPIPSAALKTGLNSVSISAAASPDAAGAKWFMISGASIMME